ncbi:MAG TPA: hypothetical protein VG712_03595, partial [Gemmatimonadales bacterium]|nr:hypothetical protein [Gemmatimonadales bacterium]
TTAAFETEATIAPPRPCRCMIAAARPIALTAPTLTEREGTAVVCRAPALARTVQLTDHGPGAGAAALPSANRAALVAPVALACPALDLPVPVVTPAVRPDTYPTGPPALS